MFNFSNIDINKFALLLGKGVYPYAFTGDWEKSNEKSLAEKEKFCINLNMENTTDSDYNHTKKNCKESEIKNLDEYNDLYFKK